MTAATTAAATAATTADDLVAALVAARSAHRPLASADWAHTLADAPSAYAAQDAVAHALGWFVGAAPLHWKSGGPSRAGALTHAPLPPTGVFPSGANLAGWPLHHRIIEGEIALRLGASVTPEQAAELTPDDVDSLIEAMAVAIEVVDSRWHEVGQAPALLRLADQQSHGALVLGDWLPYARRDWATQACTACIGSQPAVQRTGSHSLGDPAWLLPTWLRHATRHGAPVPAGTVVTTGTWVGMLPARAGDAVSIEFTGIGRAELHL